MRNKSFSLHHLVCLAFFLLSFTLIKSVNANDLKEQTTLLADFADHLCTKIQIDGYINSIELSGKVKAELQGLLKRMADIGIEGTAQYQEEKWSGVIQKDLTNILIKNIDCRLKVLETLHPIIIPSIPPIVIPGDGGKLKKLLVNRLLKCVQYCDSNDLFRGPGGNIAVKITVESFTLDTAHKKTLMHLLLESQHDEADCRFRSGDFVLQDAIGNEYLPGGQLNGGGAFFSLEEGVTLKLTGQYSFLPSSGSTYTLPSVMITCNGNAYTPSYANAQFSF